MDYYNAAGFRLSEFMLFYRLYFCNSTAIVKFWPNAQVTLMYNIFYEGAGYISAKSTSNLMCMKYVYNFIDYALSWRVTTKI